MRSHPKVNVAWLALGVIAMSLGGDTDYPWIARAALGFVASIFILLFGASIQNAIDHRKDRP